MAAAIAGRRRKKGYMLGDDRHYGHPYLSPLEKWVKTGKVFRFLTALKVR
jgi:hypothetical protein